MVWVAGVIGGWMVISAALVVIMCIFSSRLSQAEGRQEIWEGQAVRSTVPADRPLRGAPSGL